MKLHFEVMLYFNLGNENTDAGHNKCSRGLHLTRKSKVPTPALQNQEVF